MSRSTAVSIRLVLACSIWAILALGQLACAPQSGRGVESPAPDTAAAQAVDDNVIKLELNRRLIDDGLGLFKDVSMVVYGGRVLLVGSVEQQVRSNAPVSWRTKLTASRKSSTKFRSMTKAASARLSTT